MIMKKILAFTLAELMVAVAVLGVLAALTIPTLSKNSSPDKNAMMMKKVYKTLSDSIEELINSPDYPGYDGVCPSDGLTDTYGLGCMKENNPQKLPCLFTQLINTTDIYNVERNEGTVSCNLAVDHISVTNGTAISSYDYYKIVSNDNMIWYFPKINGFKRVQNATVKCCPTGLSESYYENSCPLFREDCPSGYAHYSGSNITAQQAKYSSIIIVVDVNGEKGPNCVMGESKCTSSNVDRMQFRVYADGQIQIVDDVIKEKLDSSKIVR